MSGRKFCAICKTYAHCVLIRFPTDPTLRQEWILRTGVVPKSETDVTTRICQIHFQEDDWDYRLTAGDKIVKLIKPAAIPSLYIGIYAPIPESQCLVPQIFKKTKIVRCAVCNSKLNYNDAIKLFDKNDFYTDFGVVLAIILQMSSRVIMSRHCCPNCCGRATKCFEVMLDMNVSTLLTTRMLQAKKELDKKQANKAFSRSTADNLDDDSCDESEVSKTMYPHLTQPVNEMSDLGDATGKCPRCDGVFNTIPKYTDHFLTHILIENRQVYRKTVGMTQTDEMEIDMGACDEYLNQTDVESCNDADEPVKIRKKKKTERKKREKNKQVKEDGILNDDSYVVEYLDDEFFDDVCLVETIDRQNLLNNESIDIQSKDDNIENLEQNLLEHNVKFEPSDFSRIEDWTTNDDVTIEILEDEMDSLAVDLIPIHSFNEEAIDGLTFKKESDEFYEEEAQETLEKFKEKKKRKQTGANSGPRVCHLCGAILKNVKSYANHMLLHDNPRKNFKTCDICGQVRGNMSQHKKTCEKQLLRNNTERERKTASANCGICGKTFADFYLPKHLLMHEMEDDVARNGPAAMDKYLQTCKLCGKRIKHLYEHMRKSHKTTLKDIRQAEAQNLTEPPTTYSCEHCGATFLQRPMFVIHLVLKHGMDPKLLNHRGNWGYRTIWNCCVCGLAFHTYNSIRRHTKEEHNGVGLDLTCEMCNKRYNCLRSLRAHINMKHIDYFKYRCAPCDMYFVKEQTLNEHFAYRCKANGQINPVGRRKRPQYDKRGNNTISKKKKTEKLMYEAYTSAADTVINEEEVFYITE